MAAQQKPFLKSGEKLRNRWIIGKLLGAGAFGQVFLANDQKEKTENAIKTEKLSIPYKSLCMEVAVMRDIGDSIHVPFIVACGRTKECRYLIMECLGASLSDLIKKNGGKLSVEATAQVTLQSISAVRAIHEAGYIHRDIKPANFAFGKHPKVKFSLFVYDFGLCRIHIINEKVRKARKQPGFKGTLKYASPAAHHNNDLGRVDDLIPVFYGAILMGKGKLPWQGIANREEIGDMKDNIPMEEMCAGMPIEYIRFGSSLYGAHYKAQPRYDKLSAVLVSILQKINIDPNTKINIPGLAES